MQLKKIEIQGFKSFADKTEIVFLDGVTTIVGPNGSGKSNISDAIKWVLGEQSVKTLRGSKMEDVIFAGTEARKKLGFAEVSLYMDNSDGSLPVEYSEVVVTRRVYRTGESQYLINDIECRLKDIQELFMDTGIGKDGYSMISQGKVDEILSSKSEERRHIFEEASGIVKYRVRKEEAVKKLENTTVSLSRVSDVLQEIGSMLEQLAVKAETAKKYLELRDKLKNYDIRIFAQNISKSDKELKKIEDEVASIKESLNQKEKEMDSLQENKENLKKRLQEVILKIEENQANFFKSESDVEKLNSEIEVENANISHSNGNIVRIDNEIAEDTEKIKLLKEEIESKITKKKSMQENRKKFETELADKQFELDVLLKSLDEKGSQIEEVKGEIEKKNQRIYDIKIEASSLESKIDSNNSQLESIRKSEEKAIISKDSASAYADDIYVSLNSKKKNKEQIEEKINAIIENKNNLEADLQFKLKKSSELKEEIMTLSSKLSYLKNVEQENEGYQKSVKSALDFAKENNMDGVYGTLASLITTSEKNEYAIEIALAGFMQNIICQREEDAKKIISYLKENSLGRVTFLPLDSIKKVRDNIDFSIKKLDGVIGYAIELVNYDDKYKEAISLALYNILIVDNIENALKISKKTKGTLKIVTLSGELIAQTGSITGGKNKIKSLGLIGRKEKIESLEELLNKKKEKIGLIEEENKKVLDGVNQAQQEYLNVKKELDSVNIEVATYTEKYENAKKEVEKLDENKKNSIKRKEEINEENKQIKNKLEEGQDEILKLEESLTSLKEQVEEYVRFNKDKQTRIDLLSEDVVNLKISLSSFDESVTSINEMEEKINTDIKNFELSISKKEEQKEDSKSKIKDSQEKITKINDKIAEIRSFKSEFENILSNLKQSKEEITEKESKIDQEIVNNIKLTEKVREALSKSESKKVKIDIEKDNLKNKMWDDYEITLTAAEKIYETLPEIDEKVDIVKEAEKVKRQITSLGEVSVSSIEEYKESKERFDFISTQKKDLEETKQKLENLIENMTGIMKQQFSKQFKLIKENFNETFKELFGGGRADLRLSDEDNILESGIEIEVQPPGKKLQNMMLLSGGERALTATALLFAILKIKTPPFCILDEIEAALDDVNVHRFAEYIKKYSKATQFIVITHRKGTMEVATCTYGVTMQEYGVSKVVSIKMK